MYLTLYGTRRGVRLRHRRGQAEVIGGLIVLTIIFMLALPIILNSFQSMQWTASQAKTELERQKLAYNEKIAVGGVNPNSELAVRAGWIPGVWINNTGTVEVTLKYLYLIDLYNNTIYKIFDLRYTRPGHPPLVVKMLKNVDVSGVSEPLPPLGEPIRLGPGENLLIVFNESILPLAPYLIAKVSTESGILHPLTGGAGGSQTLYPSRTGGVSGGAGGVTWRGVFVPLSGFYLRGASELLSTGEVFAWKPPILVVGDIPYRESFIYDDNAYPGLYKIRIVVDTRSTLYITVLDTSNPLRALYSYTIRLNDGDVLIIKGFLGTYYTYSQAVSFWSSADYTYVSGYAHEIILNGEQVIGISGNIRLDNWVVSIDVTDFDGNGINEVTVYSLLNGPNYDSKIDNDADVDGSQYYDALAWTYIAARDISNIDYIKISAKINYYWTATFSSLTGCPASPRNLRIFALAIWKYDEATGAWRLYQYKDYGFKIDKPIQFQATTVFPVDRSGTYRVGVIFYDNYRDFDGAGYSCWVDFTLSLEHLVVEYGMLNPLFKESPPVYIVAIPDPTLINDIGETEYAQLYNITDINTAKIEAQEALLSRISSELEYAGIVGYTIINSTNRLCDLLFDITQLTPPKYAVIIWLQGSTSIYDVTAGVCDIRDSDLAWYIGTYRWVWVWPFGEPFGNANNVIYYNNDILIDGPGSYELTITDAGISIRREAYAFYLYNNVTFLYRVEDTSVNDANIITQATFYADNPDNPQYYGTVAFWLSVGTGAVILNPVHVDWDVSGDGAIPETIAQQVVYSSLKALEQLKALG